MRAPSVLLGACAIGVLFVPSIAGAKGHQQPKRPAVGREQPIGTRLKDGPTTLSVPLDDATSLVLGLPPRFWLQIPRHGPNPASLAGEGLIAQYLNDRGGSVSMLYAGSVEFTTKEAKTAEERAAGSAGDFAASLAAKYLTVGWTVTTGGITVEKQKLEVDGKSVTAWRTSRYSSHPNDYGGPESTFWGECVMFRPEGMERLVYVALDAKGGGTTLDKATEDVSIRPSAAVNAQGRRCQIIDEYTSTNPDRYPVRQIAFDLPAGFRPTLASSAIERPGPSAWVEQRIGATGRVDAVLRLHQRHVDKVKTLAADLESERGMFTNDPARPPETIPTSTAGTEAVVFTHPSPEDAGATAAHTALFKLDDLIVSLTWVSLGDAAQAEADRTAFAALVRSIDQTTRW